MWLDKARSERFFVTKYAKDLDRNSGESVVEKKLLGSSLKFIDAFTKEARLLH